MCLRSTGPLAMSPDHHLFQISNEFDRLAAQCRSYLTSLGTVLDVSEKHYDRISVVLEICAWMERSGFTPALGKCHSYRVLLSLENV